MRNVTEKPHIFSHTHPDMSHINSLLKNVARFSRVCLSVCQLVCHLSPATRLMCTSAKQTMPVAGIQMLRTQSFQHSFASSASPQSDSLCVSQAIRKAVTCTKRIPEYSPCRCNHSGALRDVLHWHMIVHFRNLHMFTPQLCSSF